FLLPLFFRFTMKELLSQLPLASHQPSWVDLLAVHHRLDSIVTTDKRLRQACGRASFHWQHTSKARESPNAGEIRPGLGTAIDYGILGTVKGNGLKNANLIAG